MNTIVTLWHGSKIFGAVTNFRNDPRPRDVVSTSTRNLFKFGVRPTKRVPGARTRVMTVFGPGFSSGPAVSLPTGSRIGAPVAGTRSAPFPRAARPSPTRWPAIVSIRGRASRPDRMPDAPVSRPALRHPDPVACGPTAYGARRVYKAAGACRKRKTHERKQILRRRLTPLGETTR